VVSIRQELNFLNIIQINGLKKFQTSERHAIILLYRSKTPAQLNFLFDNAVHLPPFHRLYFSKTYPHFNLP
jgi:hypothetical protein